MQKSYYIIISDGVETHISENEFRKILKEDNARAKRGEPRLYFHYEDQNQENKPDYVFHALMERSEKNEPTYRLNKRDKDAAAKQRERDTRCRNENGTICTGVCRDCDKNGERESHAPLSLDDFVGDRYEPVDRSDIAQIMEDKQLLEALVASLSDDEFALIDALYYQDYTMLSYAKEQSENTGSTLDAMRSRLRRLHSGAMKKLKEILKDWR